MLGEIQYSQLVRANVSESFQFGTLLLVFVILLAIMLSTFSSDWLWETLRRYE